MTGASSVAPKRTQSDVAVIGAGIAGLACARELVAAGCAVTVLDKGRKPGGRCATRRTGQRAFDHGAQYFTVSDPRFGDAVASAEGSGFARRWGEGIVRLDPRIATMSPDAPSQRWVGCPGMSGFPAHLARDLTLRSQVRIDQVARTADGWRLTAADGAVAGPFATLIVALPAPQAVPLLSASPVLADRAASARLAPCWALMASFEDPLGPPYVAATLAGGPLAWICNDRQKPGRSADGQEDTWIAHAGPDWSRAHLEEPMQMIVPVLLQALGDARGRALPQPTFASAHRWRYARVETPVGAPCLYDPDLGLGACGDWCLGPRIEAAYLSGVAMADRVIAGA